MSEKKAKISREVFRDATAMIPKIAKELAPVYRLLEWRWGNRISAAPTEAEIADTISELFRKVSVGGLRRVEAGGIAVEFEDDGTLSVSFIKEYNIYNTGEEK